MNHISYIEKGRCTKKKKQIDRNVQRTSSKIGTLDEHLHKYVIVQPKPTIETAIQRLLLYLNQLSYL